MPYINYIELNVPNTKQAADFYRAVFGWEPQSWGGDPDYLVAGHGEQPGIDAAIRKAPDGKPLAVAIITVPKLEDTLAAAVKAGATVIVEKFAIAGVGYAAYFTDPGGMIVGVHEYDENAK